MVSPACVSRSEWLQQDRVHRRWRPSATTRALRLKPWTMTPLRGSSD